MNDTGPHVVDRDESINWFRETRRRTAGLFGLLIPEAYYDQPIPLRHGVSPASVPPKAGPAA